MTTVYHNFIDLTEKNSEWKKGEFTITISLSKKFRELNLQSI